MRMSSVKYEDSKKITPGDERPEFKYLNLIRERHGTRTLIFRLFLSKTERPAMIKPRDVFYHPERFSDSIDARRVYFSVDSFKDFTAAIRKNSNARGNMAPMGSGDDIISQPDNYDNL